MKIAILGGGISGCALARMLAGDGHNVTVLEKTERPGGLCKSRKYGEFTFDEAGGHIVFSKDQEVLDWQIARCGGEAGITRPLQPDNLSDAEWADYLFNRTNTKGAFKELWNHSQGCRRWFEVERNTVTYEIARSYRLGDDHSDGDEA